MAGSQILTVLPLLPLARRLPSGAQATDLTQSQCSVSWHSSSPVGFQILTVLSQLPLGGEKCCDPRCCPAARSCVCRAVPFWHGVCLVARRNETPCHLGTASAAAEPLTLLHGEFGAAGGESNAGNASVHTQGTRNVLSRVRTEET